MENKKRKIKPKMKILTVVILTLLISLNNLNKVEADGTKIMTVIIGEGSVDRVKQTKMINIPNLKNVTSIHVNTGNVTHTIDGDNLTINVDNGAPSRQVNNPTKNNKVVSTSRTSTSNSFPSSESYNSGGFSGTLSKNGVATTQTKYKYVTLSAQQYVKTVGIQNIDSGRNSVRTYLSSNRPIGSSYTFSYEGNSYNQKITGHRVLEYVADGDSQSRELYGEWSAGSIQVADGSEYVQNYRGTVYKAGIDSYYKYSVTIKYVDNSNPVIELLEVPEELFFKSGTEIAISGVVFDNDTGQDITVMATIDGKTKKDTVIATELGTPWRLTWESDEITDNIYNNIIITAEDSSGGTNSKNYMGDITIDKINPVMNLNIKF